MGALMGYMVKVAIIMTILYLVYKLLMSGISFHALNRKIILVIYAVSWGLPAIVGFFPQPGEQPVLIEFDLSGMTSVIIQETEHVKKFDWAAVVAYIYLAGLSIMVVITLFSLGRMASIIRKGKRIRSEKYTVKISEEAPGPFSWGNYIIVRPADLDESLELVIRHEAIHLRKRHWVDLIPARVTLILQWFSPAAWLLQRELREVHEFEVDEIAAADNIYEYQLMLIKKTAGSRFPVFADSLNHSQIKKRLTMMRTKSNPKRRVAAVALPLAACAAVLLISQPVIARVVDRLTNVEIFTFGEGKVNENDFNRQIKEMTDESVSFPSSVLHASPADSEQSFSKDDVILNEMIGKTKDTAKDLAIAEANKMTYFIDGKEYKGSISDLDPATFESMQIIKNDPAYPDFKVMINTKPTESSGDKNQATKEKMAQFKGGEKELLTFLMENIKYPSTETGIEENPIRVIVSFNIMTDGKVDDIRIRKSGGEAFDEEALEVVAKTSGKWEPAEENGKPVVSEFTIPIIFKSKP